jgi:hypothetical protein
MFAPRFCLSLFTQVMKRIIVVVIVLFTAIITMAYLYFHRLNAERINSDSGLHAAILTSPLVFSFQNDKSVLEILKGQNLFSELVGEENFNQMVSLKEQLLNIPLINGLVDEESIYVSLIPSGNKKIDLVYTTQINDEATEVELRNTLQSAGVVLSAENGITKLILSDSSVFFLGFKDDVVILSETPQPVKAILALDFRKTNKFGDYIKSNSRLSKTSLAELYINFNELPQLLESVIPGKLSGELSPLYNQNSYGSFVYNFSKNKILLTGTTITNEPQSYYELFAATKAQKITITNILPQNTANYSVFTIDDYGSWNVALKKWFTSQNTIRTVENTVEKIKKKYHLNLDQVFPRYFNNQLVTFQLSTTEKLGAISLSNGDKTEQLLLELSTEYSEEIRLLRESDLFYVYFGEPFKKFKRPYYTILDNYMVFANNASTLQSFLNSYRNNRLLENDTDYSNTINLLPNTACISFFVDFRKSRDIFRRNIYLPYYRHFLSEKGLKNYSSFTYQLNGDNGKFQSNILLDKHQILNTDSLAGSIDSLSIGP